MSTVVSVGAVSDNDRSMMHAHLRRDFTISGQPSSLIDNPPLVLCYRTGQEDPMERGL